MRGWTKVQPQPPVMSKARMVEDAAEFARLYAECRGFRQTRERLIARGFADGAAQLRPRGGELADRLSYALKVWQREGTFPTWWKANGETVHQTVFCAAITPRTPVVPVANEAGETADSMVERGYKVCAHCRKRKRLAMECLAERGVTWWVDYLRGPGGTDLS